MSDHRRARPRNTLTMDKDSDSSDDETPWSHQSNAEAARRFLWDENVPETGQSPLVLARNQFSISSAAEVNLKDSVYGTSDHIADISQPKKRSIFGRSGRTKLTSIYDADPTSNDDDDSPGGFLTACRNCYHTLLGGCGMCVEMLCSGKLLCGCCVAIVFAAIALEIVFLLEKLEEDDYVYPFSEENRKDGIISVLEQDPYVSASSFGDPEPNADQKNALDWLVDDDKFRGSDNISHRYALAALYFALNGGGWKENEEWMSEQSFCAWHGVECVDGELVGLVMAENNLGGTLNPEIGALHTLTALDLQKNYLSGTLPTEITNLEFLVELNLMENRIVGIVPDLGSLTSLRELNLGENNLDSVDNPSGFADLQELRALGLQGNNLNDPISDLAFPKNLEILYLDHNRLNGNLPDSLYELTGLKEFWVDKNDVSGTISTQFGAFENLKTFHLENNRLTGAIPPEVCTLVEDGSLTSLSADCTDQVACECCHLCN